MGLVSEVPPEALPCAMRLFETLKDVFHPTDLEWLADRCVVGVWGPMVTVLVVDAVRASG
jgi:hypothetical protein